MASTIKDIASQTGLGLATISKYLNGGKVREKNRVAIERAIAELHYTANEFARGLKTNRSKTIGIVIPELSSLFITTIITIVEDILRRSGYAILVCDCRTDAHLEQQAVQFLINKGVDGLLSMPVSQDGSHLKPAIEKKVPVVLIDRMVTNYREFVDAVMVDNVQASHKATEYLIERGHKHIGIIIGPEHIYTSKQRLLGYRQAMNEHDLANDDATLRYSDYSVQGGYESTMQLLTANRHLTALLVTNYDMTLGAIIALNELGLKFPQDLSLIGFDNMTLSQVVRPQLTTVAQPMQQIGQHAAHLVLSRLDGKQEGAATIVTLSTQLMEGASVAVREERA